MLVADVDALSDGWKVWVILITYTVVFIHKEGIILKIFQTDATPFADMLKYYSP